MQDSDLAQVVSIERHTQISPWSRLSFEESLISEHHCRCLVNNDRVVGYSVVQPIVDELHILNIVIAPSQQGKGYSHDLMNDIFSLAQARQTSKIFLDVRESNMPARALYAKWGFEQISVRKNYYRTDQPDQRETALIYLRRISPA